MVQAVQHRSEEYSHTCISTILSESSARFGKVAVALWAFSSCRGRLVVAAAAAAGRGLL